MAKWRPVPGYEGLYEASDEGSVRRLPGTVPLQSRWGTPMLRPVHGVLLTPCYDADGYQTVRLCKGGRAATLRLGRVILAAATGAFENAEAAHLNNIRTDNRLANLEWQTRLENEQHKTATGRRPRATVPSFSPRAVSAVRSMRASGFTLQEMSALFGVHYTTLQLICSFKTWR